MCTLSNFQFFYQKSKMSKARIKPAITYVLKVHWYTILSYHDFLEKLSYHHCIHAPIIIIKPTFVVSKKYYRNFLAKVFKFYFQNLVLTPLIFKIFQKSLFQMIGFGIKVTNATVLCSSLANSRLSVKELQLSQ